MRLSDALMKVKNWHELEFGDWLWIVVTALSAIFMIAFSFIQAYHNAVVAGLGTWVESSTFITGFWLVWLAIGHNTLTLTYAVIEKWHWNAFTVGAAFLVAVLIGIWPALVEAVQKQGGNYVAPFLIGIVLVVAATIWWRARKH